MIFKYSQYKDFLLNLKKAGKMSSFQSWRGERAFLLRHDVDFDIALAYKLALIEKKYGVLSTYFILVTAETYNPSSMSNRAMIKEISGMGFEIGLHFDASVYPGLGIKNLEAKVREECAVLSAIIGKKIKSVSLHNPSVDNFYPMFDKYTNAYDPRFFSNQCYVSDSCMDFRGKNINDFIKRIEDGPVQILLHPMHYSEAGRDYPDIICRHIVEYSRKIHDNFKVNKSYTKQLKCSLMDYLKAYGGSQ